MKRLLALIMALAMLLSSGVLAAVSFPLSVYVDGQRVQFPDATPFIDGNNRTMVPVRFVSEALNAEVGWDGALRQVTVTKDSKKIVLTINKPEMQINGVTKVLDCAPLIVDDRTFVPIRFVSEALDAVVEWDGAVRTVYISTKKKEEEKKQEDEKGNNKSVDFKGLNVEVEDGDVVNETNTTIIVNKKSGLSIQTQKSYDNTITMIYQKRDYNDSNKATEDMIDVMSNIFTDETLNELKDYISTKIGEKSRTQPMFVKENGMEAIIISNDQSITVSIGKSA